MNSKIPFELAGLRDQILSGMPETTRESWLIRFDDAIQPKANLSLVVPCFLHWMLAYEIPQYAINRQDVIDFVDRSRRVITDWIETGSLNIPASLAETAREQELEILDKAKAECGGQSLWPMAWGSTAVRAAVEFLEAQRDQNWRWLNDSAKRAVISAKLAAGWAAREQVETDEKGNWRLAAEAAEDKSCKRMAEVFLYFLLMSRQESKMAQHGNPAVGNLT